MQQFIRKHLLAFKAYEPGLSIEEIQAKYNLGKIIKLASNENPLGTSPCVIQVLKNYLPYAFRYPREGNVALKKELAKFLSVPEANIVIGNGSDEIIDLLIRLLVEPGENSILTFRPCFSIYKTQARVHKATLKQVPLNKDFSFNLDELLNQIDATTRLIFITNPDNPSGYAVEKQVLQDFAQELPPGCFLVIDEAYIDFADPLEHYSFIQEFSAYPQVIFLRTFSKLFGLAGLRLGYAVLNEDLADYFWRIRLPFSVNILAEKAGLAALQDTFFYQETRRVVLEGRKFLSTKLQELGCEVFPSQANFILFKPPIEAKDVFDYLLKKGLIIRRLTSYGLPDFLRVSVGTEEENKIFLTYLQEILGDR
ncbi:MAG: histidinol-phosphate transaminase [Desulfonauticus sp.]|nr:histidinol-phosphate transaminase [Desulfonauticus sp.]